MMSANQVKTRLPYRLRKQFLSFTELSLLSILLCEPNSMKPAFGVDLVKPISREETRSADQFIEDLFISAGLPLVHVPASEKYELADLLH
jgi:hypothetical protein